MVAVLHLHHDPSPSHISGRSGTDVKFIVVVVDISLFFSAYSEACGKERKKKRAFHMCQKQSNLHHPSKTQYYSLQIIKRKRGKEKALNTKRALWLPSLSFCCCFFVLFCFPPISSFIPLAHQIIGCVKSLQRDK